MWPFARCEGWADYYEGERCWGRARRDGLCGEHYAERVRNLLAQ